MAATRHTRNHAGHDDFPLTPYLIITTAYLLLTLSFLSGATVHVRLLDAETSSITPAMVCITGANGEVRLPPDGRVMTAPSSTQCR